MPLGSPGLTAHIRDLAAAKKQVQVLMSKLTNWVPELVCLIVCTCGNVWVRSIHKIGTFFGLETDIDSIWRETIYIVIV